jgi:aspartate ammonia-lyase
MRVEKDSLGKIEIPEKAWYGIHTVRSMKNFSAAGETVPSAIVHAIVRIKSACASANEQLGDLDRDRALAIQRACEKILDGSYDDQFPIDLFQSGSGTSTNMNVNEVVANLAAVDLGANRGDKKKVHPNDHVNKGQSTNNVFPSAIRIAAVGLCKRLEKDLDRLINDLFEKSEQFSAIPKSGRTHLQDAVPITMGQSFSGYGAALSKDRKRILDAMGNLLELGVGGNAVGTGINTRSSFRSEIVKALNALTGHDFIVAENGVEITQFMTDIGQVSSSLKLLALDLLKITNDLRLLASGPNTGLREIFLPAVEPGSSIMPGKINPSICEAANMACIQVVGYDAAVAMSCGLGQLELNTHMPLIGGNLVKSLEILRRTVAMLNEKCIRGITVNEKRCRHNFEVSAGLATVLNPALGYDRVAELVKEGLERQISLKDLVAEKKLMTEEALQKLLDQAFGPTP